MFTDFVVRDDGGGVAISVSVICDMSRFLSTLFTNMCIAISYANCKFRHEHMLMYVHMLTHAWSAVLPARQESIMWGWGGVGVGWVTVLIAMEQRPFEHGEMHV